MFEFCFFTFCSVSLGEIEQREESSRRKKLHMGVRNRVSTLDPLIGGSELFRSQFPENFEKERNTKVFPPHFRWHVNFWFLINLGPLTLCGEKITKSPYSISSLLWKPTPNKYRPLILYHEIRF